MLLVLPRLSAEFFSFLILNTHRFPVVMDNKKLIVPRGTDIFLL